MSSTLCIRKIRVQGRVWWGGGEKRMKFLEFGGGLLLEF